MIPFPNRACNYGKATPRRKPCPEGAMRYQYRIAPRPDVAPARMGSETRA